MNDFDLLDAVQPSEGWFAVLGIKGDDVRQKLVATREELEEVSERFVAQHRNVFFGVAKYKTGDNRTKGNVRALKAFWLDIDCGEQKAEVNPKTGIPDGYIDQATGLKELQRFCKLIGLPKPTIVNSGRGLHVYWALSEEITREEWEPVADRLHQLCLTHDLFVDASVFEVARILRIPGTLNFKDDPPSEVSVMTVGQPTDYDDLIDLLGVEIKELAAAPKRQMTALGMAMMRDMSSSFSKIMVRSRNGDGCQQLRSCYQDRENLSEPRWFDALSVAKFCDDRDEAIHRLSSGHPDYDFNLVEQKIQHILGPHTCDEFEKHNPHGCDDCPHKGKLKSPITLGKLIIEAEEEDNIVVADNEVHTIPPYPAPFFRGKSGGIYYMPPEDEAEPVRVYENDLYVVNRMRDPQVGDVVVMKLHLPQDGVIEFVVPNTHVTDTNELRKELSSKGVLVGKKQFGLLTDYIMLAIKELQHKKKAEQMRLQFGWADKNSKFIVGDREITAAGTFHSPPSSTTTNLAQHMIPQGSLENWKEVFKLYGKQGMEPHAFAALTGFGAPLLKFVGQNGAVINVIHNNSGTGKSTILWMINSIWGDPEKLAGIAGDTLNAKILKLGIVNNLPNTVDEITNLSAKEFSELIYNMSQGRGKDRVKSSANELRQNLTSWQTISVFSSNASFYEKLAGIKNRPEGEMMRLLEYAIDYTDENTLETGFAKHMFDHKLKENFGHAGDIYASWLVANLEEVRNTILSIQAKIDREIKLTQRERFWSAVAAANITGGLIAKNLGLIDWDMKAIYAWVTKMIMGLREDTAPPAHDSVAVIGDYINRHMQNILVVNEANDLRTAMPTLPQLEPRGKLLIRYEPDTKMMYMAAKAFKQDCIEAQINYKDTVNDLKSRGIFVGTMNKRLSKGMKVAAPGVHSMIFDCSGSEFINVEDLVIPEESADESGEG